MKKKAEIEKLITVATKRSNQALLEKLKITKTTPNYAQRSQELSLVFMQASTMANTLRMVLDKTPLTDQDLRYLFTDCG
ncbi:hypothetical protein [Spirosoma sordidisoli]|uniref:Uncharacterized protein n=1 Tax=Spirosoma sordidisoli TaxID=2502893 RepID=A0A4Q2UUW8_9BACT|nr:hypothetical protein [Spirosoma sordidisoli]RYC70699.1 hypothetical protein EQG79_00675 [Spirosoma sordidisoli]